MYIDEEPEAIVKKVKRAQTDSGSEVVRGPDKAGITNLIDIYSVARGVSPDEVEREFAGQGYGEFKQSVGEAVAELLAPSASATPSCARTRTPWSAPCGGRGSGARAGRPHHGGGPFRHGTGSARLNVRRSR